MNQKDAEQAERAIKTTMIGAISEFEKMFGHLWGHGAKDGETTQEEDDMYEDFMYMRDVILDLGNDQIRKLKRT